MTSSTTTLAQLMSSVLLDVGERPSVGVVVSGNVNLKCYSAITDAFIDIITAPHWSWLQVTRNPLSWSAEKATVGAFLQLHAVQYDGTNISWIDSNEFDGLATATPFVTASTVIPEYYTIQDDAVIRVNPYPNDATTRAKLKVIVTDLPSMPASNNTALVFPIPELVIPLLKLRSCYHYALKHLDDIESSQRFQEAYMRMFKSLQARSARIPSRGVNMFRRRE